MSGLRAVTAAAALLAAAQPAAGQEILVVVELYTSEGCSSCPPADETLDRLARESADAPGLFIPLAFHVDYWDHLGWADPFATPANGERQKRYDRKLSPTRVYTPQAIVNGAAETVGSSEKQLPRLLAQAREEPATVAVTITGARSTEAGWEIDYTASGELKGILMFAAVVESGVSSRITAGENAGMLLVHNHLVRGFAEAGAAASGTIAVSAPGTAPGSTHLVVLAQEKEALRVRGGARRALEELQAGAGGD